QEVLLVSAEAKLPAAVAHLADLDVELEMKRQPLVRLRTGQPASSPSSPPWNRTPQRPHMGCQREQGALQKTQGSAGRQRRMRDPWGTICQCARLVEAARSRERLTAIAVCNNPSPHPRKRALA